MRECAFALLIVALAAVLRFTCLWSVPWAVHFDEAYAVDIVSAMQAGDWSAFRRTATGNPGSQVLLQWAWSQVVPNALLAGRLHCATLGVLLVGATMWLGRVVTGSRTTGIVAGAVLAVDPWAVLMARNWAFSAAPFGAAIALGVVVQALNGDSRCRTKKNLLGWPGMATSGLAGILFGLALTFYDPIKIVLAVAPAYWLWRCCTLPGFARQTWLRVTTLAVTASVTLLTVLGPVGREGYWDRFWRTTSLAGLDMEGRTVPWTNVAHVVLGGARIAADRALEIPLISPLLVVLSLIGVFATPQRSLLLIWIAATLGAVALSNIPDAGYRLAVMLPAVAVLAATGLRVTWTANRWAAGLLVSLQLMWSATVIDDYVVRGRVSAGQELGRFIAAGPDVRYYVAAPAHWTGDKTFRALTSDRQLVSTPEQADIVVTPGWVSRPEGPAVVDLVDPAGRTLGWWSER